MSEIKAQIHKAMEEFLLGIEKDLEKRCRFICEELIDEAIKNREGSKGKHDFTGNFLNSIVVCLYKKGSPLVAYSAAEKVGKRPIQKKMSAVRKRYIFEKDYEESKSQYKPEQYTDMGYGNVDAIRFFQSYRPKGNFLFDIVVAYPVEYASFIEIKRGTAGYFKTKEEAKNIAITYLGI
ncbi:hypothetical protein [Prevotella amnii]|uniref:Uncharacterized protein n=1 Tax=Prevotella amnii DNF00058 TaxID=1401066 RepID=A0A096CC10_9BACT|nr:hypothetical protein [Prevotella amnii]KGF52442.1 hypothetical protein HMPREF9302_04000 [Prevotella amnii DNF00058]